MSIDKVTSLFFGKLPAYGDFVRHNASKNEVIAFDQWLQQGIQSSKNLTNVNWNSVFDNSPAYHFHFYLNPQQSLIGIWHPSMDSAGRRFPFVLASIIEGQYFNKHLYVLIPILFRDLLGTARQLFRDALLGIELAQIVQRIESLDNSLNIHYDLMKNEYHNYLSNTTLESFVTHLWGSFNDSGKYLLMNNLTEILLPLRNQDFSRISLGLKFPLCQDFESYYFNVCFWLDLTANLLEDTIYTPYYFWSIPKNEKPAHFFLLFRTPPAKNFSDLIGTHSLTDNICELDQEGKENINRAIDLLAQRYMSLIETPSITLQQFLGQLSGKS